jgi:hypothetical protein
MVRRAAWSLVVAGVVTVLAACAPTARTTGPYAARAVDAATAVNSSISSDILLIRAVAAGHVTREYTSVATSESEDDATSAASSFAAIQPPSKAADQLRDELTDVFNDATSVLADARIAGRRGDAATLIKLAPSMRDLSQRLASFIEAHQ